MAGTSELSWEDDTRPACKYGEKCYQKNPQHHKRFKHPPKRKREDSEEEVEEETKRSRTEDTEQPDEALPVSPVPEHKEEDSLAGVKEDEEQEHDEEQKEEEEVTDDEVSLPDSPEDVKLSIEQKFLVEMPKDFYDFWECCSNISKKKPEEALLEAGLTLVGPYDILTGKLKNLKERKVSSYVCHWRYYYDPPEFMTVIAGDENDYHIGYYRDDPGHLPDFVASMSSDKEGRIKPLGENIFAGVCSYLSEKIKSATPFKKTPLTKLQKEVEAYAKKKDYSLLPLTPNMKSRNKKVVAKTFHGAGIVVPVHNDVGYRELPETYGCLRKMMQKLAESKSEDAKTKNFEPLQEIITNVQFASDEGDFGMGLELGINFFTHGAEVLHKPLLHLLCVAYDLLGREPYINILKAHLKNRRRGSQLSILDTGH